LKTFHIWSRVKLALGDNLL